MSFGHGLPLGAFKSAVGEKHKKILLSLNWESVKSTPVGLGFSELLFGVDLHLGYCYDV